MSNESNKDGDRRCLTRLVRRCVDSPDHPWDGKEVVLLGEAVEVTEPTWICGLPTGGYAMQIPERLLDRILPANKEL